MCPAPGPAAAKGKVLCVSYGVRGIWDVGLQLLLRVPKANMPKSQNVFAEMHLQVIGGKLISRTFTCQWHEPQPVGPWRCLFSSDLIQNIAVPIDLGLLIQNHLSCILYGDSLYSQEALQQLHSQGLLRPRASSCIFLPVLYLFSSH